MLHLVICSSFSFTVYLMQVQSYNALHMHLNSVNISDFIYNAQCSNAARYRRPSLNNINEFFDEKNKWRCIFIFIFQRQDYYWSELRRVDFLYVSLFASVLFATVMFATVMFATVMFATVMFTTVLFATVMFATVVFATVMFDTVMFATVMFATVMFPSLMFATLRYNLLLSIHTQVLS